MSEEKKPVIERGESGDFILAAYGEFLSYYHAHLQLFKKVLQTKGYTAGEINKTINKIKNFMVGNIKKINDFTENIEKFAAFLSLSPDEFNAFMSENFIGVLNKVQEKLIAQELETRKSMNDFSYNSITEEIVEVIGEVVPVGHRFIKQENLLVVENTLAGTIIEPAGVLSQIKKEQQEELEKKEALKNRRSAKKEVVFEVEKSLLLELVETFPDSLGQPVDLDKFLPKYMQESNKEVETIIKEPKKPEGLLSDVPELDFDDDEIDITEPDIEPETPPDMDSIDLEDVLADVPSGPDEADTFLYGQYLDIIKTVQGYRQKKDNQGYNSWLASADIVTKSIVSIKGYIARESAGQSIDWQKNIDDLAEKAGLPAEVINKLVNRSKHFDLLRLLMDKTVQQFKTFPPDTLKIAKSGWPHIQKALQQAPDYPTVEDQLQKLMAKIPSAKTRSPIENILNKCIQRLKTDYETYESI